MRSSWIRMSPKPNDRVLIRDRKGHSDTEKAVLRWTKAETQPWNTWATRRDNEGFSLGAWICSLKALPTPSFQISSLQSDERIIPVVLSHPVCVSLLQRPQEMHPPLYGE